jgi:hypothetical protein
MHSLDKMFEDLLMGVLREKPSDPLQFIIDTLSLGPEHAAQASDTAMCNSSAVCWARSLSAANQCLACSTRHDPAHGMLVAEPGWLATADRAPG